MLLAASKFIFICLEVLVFFNLMIIVHELGHFLAARWRGLVIEKFGIWFGKPLWQKKIGGVTYSLGSIPAGGFVALPQLAPMEVMEGKTETPREQLPPISALDKIIVAFAGPLFSFLLAVVFAVIVWQVGRPVSESEASTTIGAFVPNSPAAAAGLQRGDKILEVDGRPVRRFGGMGDDSISWRIVRSEGETVPVKVERNSQVLTFEIKPIVPKTSAWSRKGLRQIGIVPSDTPMVAKVEKGSAAEKAGLKPNDLIVEVNGERLLNPNDISEFAQQHPSEQVVLTVERGNEKLKIPFAPRGAKIEEVSKDSPAAVAGLKPGDRVVGVDGQAFTGAVEITQYIRAHPGAQLALTIETASQQREVRVTPQLAEIPADSEASDEEKGPVPRIGVVWDHNDLGGITLDKYGKFHVINPGVWEQIRSGTMSIVNTIDAIVSRGSGVKLQHMGGPVMMMRVYYIMFESPEGWRMALWFSVVLNINLALINLLPIPVLDGGHITLALVEAVRRRPVNARVLEYVQTACAVMIIGFMLYIAFFDVQDLFGGKREMKFRAAPTPASSR